MTAIAHVMLNNDHAIEPIPFDFYIVYTTPMHHRIWATIENASKLLLEHNYDELP